MFLIDADYFVTAIDAAGHATLVNARTGDEIDARIMVNLNDGALRVVTDTALLEALDRA